MKTAEISAAYRGAKKRLLLIDYDGVLVPIMPTPEAARPNTQTLQVVQKLTQDSYNTCVIISGRPHDVLQEWLGEYDLTFAAEHGLWRKEQNGEWMLAQTVATNWKRHVKRVMTPAVAALPGSFIEEKYAGLAFHYRKTVDADATVHSVLRKLELIVDTLNARIIHGKKVIEVVPAGVDKGVAAQYWLQYEYDFILAVGDDTTDEALFKTLPTSAFSIKIGTGETAARHALATQKDFVAFVLDL